MRRALPYIYFGFNLACALMLLRAGHRVAAFMVSEGRDFSDFGDSLSFISEGGSAVMLALLASLLWLRWTLTAASRRASYRPIAWFGAAAAVWIAAFIGVRLL